MWMLLLDKGWTGFSSVYMGGVCRQHSAYRNVGGSLHFKKGIQGAVNLSTLTTHAIRNANTVPVRVQAYFTNTQPPLTTPRKCAFLVFILLCLSQIPLKKD